jgi:hypothetical protein
MRHYPDRDLSFFEVKTKQGPSSTIKHRFETPYGSNALGDKEKLLVSTHTSLPASLLQPQTWTRFHRLTLVGLHINERVTVDVGLELGDEDHPIRLRGAAIIEVKQSPFCVRTPVMDALRRAKMRPGSSSKYCAAIALSNRDVRRNRLLPMLRTMERLAR